MKRIKIVLLLFILLLIFMPISVSKVFAANEDILEKTISKEVFEHANSCYLEMFQILCDYDEETSSLIEEKTIYLGEPFVIYDFEKSLQTAIYYFPIIANENVVSVLSVIDTSEGWTSSMDQELVDFLNQNNYINEKGDSYLYIENNQLNIEKVKKSFSVKAKETLNKNNQNIETHFIKADIKTSISKNDPENDVDSYSRSFSTNTSTSKICSLYNKKTQGAYGMCWAASLATILNYLDGTNIEPIAICDYCNKGYNEGASISFVKSKMSHYTSLYYTQLAYLTISNEDVKLNIQAKDPIYISSVDVNNSSSGHAVVIYGYQTINYINDYIAIWNPGINQVGGTQIVQCLGASTVFAYNNSSFRWRYTLSKLELY